MGYRIFTDSQGTEWQAWDIIPQLAERRARQRRHARARVEADRRVTEERRKSTGERSMLGHGLERGWLCFETAREKRRLAPIPGDWLRCAAARLEEYMRQAVPAVRVNVDVPLLGNLRAG